MEIEITSFASTGKGVGTINFNGFNRSVFVDGGIPGDICEVEITKEHKKYYEATIKSLIKESPYRIKPICKSFGVCGGCSWLSVDYSFQLESKKQILSFLFSKLNLSPAIQVIPCDSPIHYRDKARIQFKDGKASFFKKRSNDLVAPEKCYIINDDFNSNFNKETDFSDGEHTFVYDYKTNSTLTKSDSKPSFSYNGITYSFGLKSFIQSNLKQNKKLIDLILELIPDGKILELYCGMGNFTLPLAKQTNFIKAIEGNPEAIRLLNENMKSNNIENIKSYASDVKEFLKSENSKSDYILLDPPRIGVDDVSSIEKISTLTNNVVYIACDPNSLIRDLKTFLKLGFKLENVRLVDMFPQTHHFETVVLLKK